MADQKALEQLQQIQKDLTEQMRSEREAARERSNGHKRQLEEQSRQLQQKLEENSHSRNDQLQRQDKDLETERAKMKEERERANADTQRQTQEHRERITMKTQEHKEHVERRYEADEKAAQEAKQGREELRNDAKESNDRASAVHLRNVETQKDGLTHMREQQKEEIHRRAENMKQTKTEQLEEQRKAKQEIKILTVENRATLIETLQLNINCSIALIDTGNISTMINSHSTAYENTLNRCATSTLNCIKESYKVKLELSMLILKFGTFSEACKNPTAADSKYWTSNEGKEKIEDMCNLVENFCETALSSLTELQSICSKSASSLSTNTSLSADLRKTYKNHLYQIDDAARKLYGAVYMINSNMDSCSSFTTNELKALDKELENGINELKKELNDIPEAQGTDGLREQLKVLEKIIKDSADRLAEINQRESERAVEDSTDRVKEIDQCESEKLDTSPQDNGIQNENE